MMSIAVHVATYLQWLNFVQSQVFSLAYLTALAAVWHSLYLEKQRSHKCPLDAYAIPWKVALYSISSPAHESLHDPRQPSQEIQGVACICRRCTQEDHRWWTRLRRGGPVFWMPIYGAVR